jgi:hypothetical protein
LAIVTVAAGVLDGALAFFWGSAGAGILGLDAVLTTLILVVEIFPFVIIGIGIRQRLGPSRWWLAISAFVSQMINTIADASSAGQRFTHWTLYYKVTTPLFMIFGMHFTAADLAGIGLFLSILYAVYRYSIEQQTRQSVLEQEMQSARELQRVLIPETLPSLDGFAIRLGNRDGNCLGMDIQPQKSCLFLHDRALSACGSALRFASNSRPNLRPAHWSGHPMMPRPDGLTEVSGVVPRRSARRESVHFQ